MLKGEIGGIKEKVTIVPLLTDCDIKKLIKDLQQDAEIQN
jgi:hypothetical protein